jgi:activator of HSP90 ATPase
MKIIQKSYVINASIEKVWDALVNPKTIEKWSGSKAVMSDIQGSDFKLWNGDIWGKNIEIQKESKLVQEWYGGKWKEPSIVTFTLKKVGDGVQLDLKHINVPEDIESFDTGWDDYYLGEIKKLLESN